MKKYIYDGKNKEVLIEKALTELNCNLDEVFIKEEENESSGLFSSKKYKVTVIVKIEFINFMLDKIKEITNLIGVSSTVEYECRGNTHQFQIVSDNDAVLIGKMGKNLSALEVLIKQIVREELGTFLPISLDISKYKENKNHHLEQSIKKIAREVKETKVEVKLDPMNSYERRLVHAALTDNKYVTTKSEGEEPHRYIVIAPKED